MFKINKKSEQTHGRIGKLMTNHGLIETPNIFPVHGLSFNDKMIMDDLMRPYLKREACGLLISSWYILRSNLKDLRKDLHLEGTILFIDSGGFASLNKNAELKVENDLPVIKTEEVIITPQEVNTIQNKYADISVPLDVPIPLKISEERAKELTRLNIKSALYSLDNRKTKNKNLLFASIQAWDYNSAREITEEISTHEFDGFAIGGLVPREKNLKILCDIIMGVKSEIPEDKPVHVFGISNFKLLPILFYLGVDLVDGSTYLQNAASKKYVVPYFFKEIDIKSYQERRLPCSCPICRNNSPNYLKGTGIRPLAFLALHNFITLKNYVSFLRYLISEDKLKSYLDLISKIYPEVHDCLKYINKKSISV